MGKSSRVQHEGIVKSISTQTLEVSIISHSACSGCHAKSACGIADMKEKVITAQRPREELRPGDKVIVYASVNNAFYSVLLAYIMPSILIIATTEVRVTMIAPMPKNSTEQMKAGMSAISTPYMFFSIESPL